jgi:hypothetical protein
MKTNKTYQQLMDYMRTEDYAIKTMAFVESIMGDNFKSLRRGLHSPETLNEYVALVEEAAGQQTVYLTVRSAYEYEIALQTVLSNAGFETVSKKHNVAGAKNDFGVVTADKGPIFFEVKTTQSDKGWTGATHSLGNGKVDNYVLISYDLDRDMKLPPVTGGSALHGAFKSVHFSVVDSFSLGWQGKASNKSSFTTAQIPVQKAAVYSKQIVLGHLTPKDIWCKPERHSLDKWRDSAGVLVP